MTPIQFAVATLWVFYGLGAIIHLNVESALKGRKVGSDLPRHNVLGLTETVLAVWFAGTGALIWWWIA